VDTLEGALPVQWTVVRFLALESFSASAHSTCPLYANTGVSVLLLFGVGASQLQLQSTGALALLDSINQLIQTMILLYRYDRCCRQATFLRSSPGKMCGSGASEGRLIDDVIILYNPVLNRTPGSDSVQHPPQLRTALSELKLKVGLESPT